MLALLPKLPHGHRKFIGIFVHMHAVCIIYIVNKRGRRLLISSLGSQSIQASLKSIQHLLEKLSYVWVGCMCRYLYMSLEHLR